MKNILYYSTKNYQIWTICAVVLNATLIMLFVLHGVIDAIEAICLRTKEGITKAQAFDWSREEFEREKMQCDKEGKQ